MLRRNNATFHLLMSTTAIYGAQTLKHRLVVKLPYANKYHHILTFPMKSEIHVGPELPDTMNVTCPVTCILQSMVDPTDAHQTIWCISQDQLMRNPTLLILTPLLDVEHSNHYTLNQLFVLK